MRYRNNLNIIHYYIITVCPFQMHGIEIFLILVHFIKIVFFSHFFKNIDRYTSFVNQQQLFSSVRSASVNQNEIELL